MDNVSLTINIYGLSTLETYEEIDENFKNPPIIEKANSPDTEGLITPNSQTTVFNWKHIENNISKPISLLIKAKSNTPHGVYFIRSELKFRYRGLKDNDFIMKSRGYIDDEDWKFASQTETNYPGNINLTFLGIDGMTPDSSIRVLEREDNKGFIPGFEMIFLISAITLTIFIMKIRKIRF